MAYRSSAIATSNTGGDLTASPAGAAANDYLGALYNQDAGPHTVGAPSGWTDRATLDTTDGSTFQAQVHYYDKVAAGGDSFTWTNGDSNPNALVVGAWSGRSTSAPRTFAQSTINNVGVASGGNATLAGGAAANGDDLAYFIGTSPTISTAVWSFGAPAGFTERQDGHAASWAAVSLGTQDAASAGATGSKDVVLTRTGGSGNAGFGAILVAIAQAAGARVPYQPMHLVAPMMAQ